MRRYYVLCLTLAGLAGCDHAHSSTALPDRASPTEVVTAKPVHRTLHYTVEQPGRIEPFEQTPIFAKIPGYLRTVRVEIGDRVKRGDLLAELDVPELVEEHKRKEALVVQAQLGIAQAEQAEIVAEAKIKTAQAEIEVAQTAQARALAVLQRWQSEYQRMDRLVQDKVLDQQSFEEVLKQREAAAAGKAETDARIRAAEATLAEARAHREKVRADRKAACNQLLVAQADERQVNALLGYVRFTAPYDGIVSDRRVHTGHFLHAGTGGSSNGDPLFVVVRMDKVRVFVEVPEIDAVQVSKNNIGRIRVQALNDREFVGKVAGTSWSLEPNQRTLNTEIDFTNKDGLFAPGMYVNALIDVTRPDAWVLPASAILIRDGIVYCYQLRDGKAQRLSVRVGLHSGGLVEVKKFQRAAASPGERPQWVDPTGDEIIITSKPGELSDDQEVRSQRG